MRFSVLVTWACMSMFIVAMSGCGEKDLYDPEYGKNELPPMDSYFGFEMKKDVHLSVNYNVPGFSALVEVYDENPMTDDNVKKEGLTPIYATFIETDKSGKFDIDMYVPTSVKEAYLYTTKLGLPTCVRLEATENGFSYSAANRAQTRGVSTVEGAWAGNKVPYQVTRSDGRTRGDNLYSLTTWGYGGDISQLAIGTDYAPVMTKVGEESFSMFADRIGGYLTANNGKNGGNAALVKDGGKLNIVIPQEGAEVSLTFVGDYAQFNNTFGYYYYPVGQTIDINAFKKIKKYVVFPNASNFQWGAGVTCGSTAKLLYFDEQTGTPTTHFPAGYAIGWFLISDGYYLKDEPYDNIREMLFDFYPGRRNMCFSNETGFEQQFISLYDKKTKKIIIGIEDGLAGNKDDFMDLLFFANTTPDIGPGELPEIPDEDAKPVIGTETIKGTLAFEDGWPTGKDFDLNDVVVQYERTITFDQKNYAKNIKEIFKFVHKEGAANLDSYFAYQVENMGDITNRPDNSNVENATKSVVFKSNAKLSVGQEFIVERTFAEGTVTLEALRKDFNPYIIVGTLKEANRIEVHLPKYPATSAADPRMISTHDDVYYTDKGGKFPFAIDIPVWGFLLSPERISISETYTDFDAWVNSGGTKYTDWYKK